MTELTFSQNVIISAQKFKAWYGKEPIIVIGHRTMQDLIANNMFAYQDEEDHSKAILLTFHGFEVSIGEFEWGYFIKAKKG
jgi:hypothetical protein